MKPQRSLSGAQRQLAPELRKAVRAKAAGSRHVRRGSRAHWHQAHRLSWCNCTAGIPVGTPSPRPEVGRVPRAGHVLTLELRAPVMIGFDRATWRIVRDLAARLPAVVLPRRLRSRSEPVGIGDVMVGLVAECGCRSRAARHWTNQARDPELSGGPGAYPRLLGHRRLFMADVPVLSPELIAMDPAGKNAAPGHLTRPRTRAQAGPRCES